MYNTALFIDGGYLAEISKTFGKPKIDFLKFSEILCKGDFRVLTLYYYCMPFQGSPPTIEESTRYSKSDRFIKSLAKLPRFEIRLGRFQKIENSLLVEYIQKGIDVMLAVDLVKMSLTKQIDKAIILTADSDFIYAVQTANEASIFTQLCYSDKHPINGSMVQVFDEKVIITDDLLNHCLLANTM